MDSIIKSISSSPIANSIKKPFIFVDKIWNKYRWELFLFISILTLIFCYFFTKQNKYNGLNSKYNGIRYVGYKEANYSKNQGGNKKYEKECRRIVESTFGVPFDTVRPSFLKNPKTNRNLELDMYNKDLRLAVEYQGAQHRTYTPFFHRKYSDFLDQLSRDELKKKRCNEEGIDLICVPDTVPYEELFSYITKELRRIKRI